jgi:hypothetical protein
MRAVKDLETKPSDLRVRKAYPGATLRHLGSVRDVTLNKTSGNNDHAGGFVKK